MTPEIQAIRGRLQAHVRWLFDESIDDADTPIFWQLAEDFGAVFAEIERLEDKLDAVRAELNLAIALINTSDDEGDQ